MKYIIDRIEENKVICENQETKQMEEFPIEEFYENPQSGDIVRRNFIKEENETQTKKEYIDELMRKLMKG